MEKNISEGWFHLRIKNKSGVPYIRKVLDESSYPYCILSDLAGQRDCCKRLSKDFLKGRLLVQASGEEIEILVRQYKEYIRYVGKYGKAVSPVSSKEFRQLTLFFDKLDRDFIFEPAIPSNAKFIRLSGGTLAGVEGYSEYRGVGGYRLYIKILDVCILSVRIDKKELSVTEKILMKSDSSHPHWYALLTRREFFYYDILSEKEYKAYIPVRKTAGKEGKEESSLVMRGYVFVRIAPVCFKQLFQDIPGSSDRLLFDRSHEIRTPLIIPDKQLEDFIFVTESSSPAVTFAEEVYTVGDKVCLRKPGFEGVEGKLIKCGLQYQVFISLANLSSGYLIKVDKDEFYRVNG